MNLPIRKKLLCSFIVLVYRLEVSRFYESHSRLPAEIPLPENPSWSIPDKPTLVKIIPISLSTLSQEIFRLSSDGGTLVARLKRLS